MFDVPNKLKTAPLLNFMMMLTVRDSRMMLTVRDSRISFEIQSNTDSSNSVGK